MQILTNEEEDNKLYTNFIYSIRGEITRKKYLTNLKYYMKFLGITTFKELLGNGNKHQKIIESDIKEYLIYLRTKKKLSYGSTIMYLAPIKKFYYVNSDYQFKWDLINMYLGDDDTTSTDDDEDNGRNRILEEEDEEDRPYTMEEVKTMFHAAQDIRVKIIISLLSSSGLRHGAIPDLKLRDLEKIEKYQLYQITVYGKSKKYKYKTFCTPECATFIDTYLQYRKKQGEQLKGNSPLIREQFNHYCFL